MHRAGGQRGDSAGDSALGSPARLVTDHQPDLTVERLGYAHPGHDSLHPLDASLNLPAERYSLEVRRRVVEAAASRSFDEALFELFRHTGADAPKRQAETVGRSRGRLRLRAPWKASSSSRWKSCPRN